MSITLTHMFLCLNRGIVRVPISIIKSLMLLINKEKRVDQAVVAAVINTRERVAQVPQTKRRGQVA